MQNNSAKRTLGYLIIRTLRDRVKVLVRYGREKPASVELQNDTEYVKSMLGISVCLPTVAMLTELLVIVFVSRQLLVCVWV
jgi:hypothetical protein